MPVLCSIPVLNKSTGMVKKNTTHTTHDIRLLNGIALLHVICLRESTGPSTSVSTMTTDHHAIHGYYYCTGIQKCSQCHAEVDATEPWRCCTTQTSTLAILMRPCNSILSDKTRNQEAPQQLSSIQIQPSYIYITNCINV